MAKKIRYGWKAKGYYRSAGTFESPTMTEISVIGNLKVSPKYSGQTIPTREGKGMQLDEPTFLGIEVSGFIRDDENDAAFLAFDAAFHAKTELDMAFLNGGITEAGSRGYRLGMKLHEWEQQQDNEGVLGYQFVLKPCISDNVKQRAVVSAEGVVAYSELAAA
ncbi:MAG: hypothetical protein KF873_01990 [Gemmataceae bacterium]|nr:hypothetical protein [Gemmataceae bacterium]